MKHYSSGSALDTVEQALKLGQKAYKRKKYSYFIPSLWVSDKGPPKRVKVDTFSFYLDTLKKARKGTPLRRNKAKATGGEWSKDAVIYNMFVRTTAAFDHNGNGKLDLPLSPEGFRETGTFLKSIAMLPSALVAMNPPLMDWSAMMLAPGNALASAWMSFDAARTRAIATSSHARTHNCSIIAVRSGPPEFASSCAAAVNASSTSILRSALMLLVDRRRRSLHDTRDSVGGAQSTGLRGAHHRAPLHDRRHLLPDVRVIDDIGPRVRGALP